MTRKEVIDMLLEAGFRACSDTGGLAGWTGYAASNGYVYEYEDKATLSVIFSNVEGSASVYYFPPGVTAQDPMSRAFIKDFNSYEKLLEFLELD